MRPDHLPPIQGPRPCKILVKADGPYNLAINLVNTENVGWCERGWPKWTIKTHRDKSSSLSRRPDYQVVMLPFQPLFDIMKGSCGGPDDLVQVLEKPEWREKVPDDEEQWIQKIRGRVDTSYFQFDRILDGEEGHTADMLRLHRLSTWYTRGVENGLDYLTELERICKVKGDGVDESIAIERRYHLALAFNPLSARKKKTSPPEVSCTHPTGPSEVDIELGGYLSDYEYGCGKGEEGLPAKTEESWLKKADGWDRKSWYRYYPSGIAKWTYDESRRLHLMGKEGWSYVERAMRFAVGSEVKHRN